MSELGWILTGVAVGAALGLFYFGLLYLTLLRLHSARRPQLVAMWSFLGRLGVTILVLFLLVRGGHWERGLAFLAGFVVVRMLLVRRWRPEPYRKPGSAPQEGRREADTGGAGKSRNGESPGEKDSAGTGTKDGQAWK